MYFIEHGKVRIVAKKKVRLICRIAVDMDIHGYMHSAFISICIYVWMSDLGYIHGYAWISICIHVCISDLGYTMDISMDMHGYIHVWMYVLRQYYGYIHGYSYVI